MGADPAAWGRSVWSVWFLLAHVADQLRQRPGYRTFADSWARTFYLAQTLLLACDPCRHVYLELCTQWTSATATNDQRKDEANEDPVRWTQFVFDLSANVECKLRTLDCPSDADIADLVAPRTTLAAVVRRHAVFPPERSLTPSAVCDLFMLTALRLAEVRKQNPPPPILAARCAALAASMAAVAALLGPVWPEFAQDLHRRLQRGLERTPVWHERELFSIAHTAADDAETAEEAVTRLQQAFVPVSMWAGWIE